ncbi:MAG: ankyrin repeat domain-containing protein [Gammaproteobacteria bacterium]|nr:ankyrin repeat domain-containing protein [Gammaproteobacteria bacterium]
MVVRRGILLPSLLVMASVLGWQQSQAADDLTLADAIRIKDRAAALALVKAGADVNAMEADATTPLMWAAHHGDGELVKRLLKAGADAKRVNDYGVTAMSEAAAIGNTEVISALLKAGADVESRNPEGQTALMAVARTGNVDAAKLLVKAGADVNATEGWGGQSALMWAAAQQQPAMVAYLIKAGADVNARGKVYQWQRKVTAEPRPKDMNKGGFTPLLYAAREGCTECARALVAGGADMNATDPDRVTPLVLALLNLHFDFAAYLIEAGADVNKWDLYGRTPVYAAVDLNTLPVGGRTDVPSQDRTTAVDVASMLLAAGANPNIQLKLRPPYRNVPFDRGGDQVLSTGATPLLRAAKASDDAMIEVLLAHGALVDLPNAEGVTPLMVAAGLEHNFNPTRGRYKTDEQGVATMQLLLSAGAAIDRADKRGRTALHGAAKKGWTNTVRFLVEHGADPLSPDASGLSAMDYAKGNYKPAFLEPPPQPHVETVAVLQQHLDAAGSGA